MATLSVIGFGLVVLLALLFGILLFLGAVELAEHFVRRWLVLHCEFDVVLQQSRKTSFAVDKARRLSARPPEKVLQNLRWKLGTALDEHWGKHDEGLNEHTKALLGALVSAMTIIEERKVD